jgi:hypothetical protein
MHEPIRYKLHIAKYTPDTIPLDRLAAYAAAFSRLLSSRPEIAFGGLEGGSTQIVAKVSFEASRAVESHLRNEVELGPNSRAIRDISSLLEQDQTSGFVVSPRGENVLEFPGATRQDAVVFPAFRESTSLDGQLVRIGGTDETVHAKIVTDDHSYNVQMNRELAREAALHIFGSTLRFFGTARYKRERSGEWTLLQFDADRFEVLNERTLSESVQELRNLQIGGLLGSDAYNRLDWSSDGGQLN